MPRGFSGIYPGLAMFNEEGECGTGAVVPWADRLWVVTYAPHKPLGSTDKLYEINGALAQTIRSESLGGTPANRMVHGESGQLFIGPYVIDGERHVRVVPPTKMFGRLTGMARSLEEPAGKILYATMEEGVYEVDVKSLEVKELWADEQRKEGRHSDLPGYHGKGFYSGQGRYVYANNGDHAKAALTDPATPTGALAEWSGKAEEGWKVVRRNQFTDVTGPEGIRPTGAEGLPMWSIGFDHRSLILMLLDGGKWRAFRLPKTSHCYDGAHGWNTEWPRIREIGEGPLLMTMHGEFWKFPRTFSAGNTAGIAPRSTYLKVVGDFARWGDRVVLGCDDAAKSEFLNKRGVKGALIGPGQSQSNLWFVAPGDLDRFGPPLGEGSVWLHDDVKAGEVSDPFLFSGFERRGLHLAHGSAEAVTFAMETDAGDGTWKPLREVKVSAKGNVWVNFTAEEKGAWVRLRADRAAEKVCAVFHFSNADTRGTEPDARFAGLAKVDAQAYSGGILRARGENLRTLAFSASEVRGSAETRVGYYELGADLQLKRVEDAKAHEYLKKNAAVPRGVISADAASVLVIDDAGRRWRLPRGDAAFEKEGPVPLRVDREVCTERDLFQAEGTFYELPAENAGGFIKMRPITTHRLRITDYCSWRGLLVLSGVSADDQAGEHIIRSEDGHAALWLGAVDDLWSLGRPTGHGGPWHETAVTAGTPSDPYLFRGYDHKVLTLSHDAAQAVHVTVELDVAGDGTWEPYRTFAVPVGEKVIHEFPAGFAGYWVRVTSDAACKATAELTY